MDIFDKYSVSGARHDELLNYGKDPFNLCMEEIYSTIDDTPQTMKDEMAAQRKRLEAMRAEKGDYISPVDL